MIKFLETFPCLWSQPPLILLARGHAQYRRDVRGVDKDQVKVGGLQLLQQPRYGVDTLEVPEVSRPQLGH